jgi:hypothetical protein
MAQHRLDVHDPAALEQLRQTMRKPEWASSEEAQGFFQEAEALCRGAATEPKQ